MVFYGHDRYDTLNQIWHQVSWRSVITGPFPVTRLSFRRTSKLALSGGPTHGSCWQTVWVAMRNHVGDWEEKRMIWMTRRHVYRDGESIEQHFALLQKIFLKGSGTSLQERRNDGGPSQFPVFHEMLTSLPSDVRSEVFSQTPVVDADRDEHRESIRRSSSRRCSDAVDNTAAGLLLCCCPDAAAAAASNAAVYLVLTCSNGRRCNNGMEEYCELLGSKQKIN